jgi:hypothetical protein
MWLTVKGLKKWNFFIDDRGVLEKFNGVGGMIGEVQVVYCAGWWCWMVGNGFKFLSVGCLRFELALNFFTRAGVIDR